MAALKMHNLKPAKGARNSVKRLGRGNASGKGTNAGRGTKGQAARSGGRSRLKIRGFRQIMLATPKLRGFNSPNIKPENVKLSELAKSFDAGQVITPAVLAKKGLISTTNNGVKIISGTELKKKLIIEGCDVTGSVREAIEKAGGEVRS